MSFQPPPLMRQNTQVDAKTGRQFDDTVSEVDLSCLELYQTTIGQYDPKLHSLASQWLRWDPHPKTQKEMSAMLENAHKELCEGKASDAVQLLEERLTKRIAFGTAGLRARMAAGFHCINHLVVLQASQGLITYVSQKVANYANRGVVVGYDGRYNSKAYAELAAAVWMSKGVKVHMFKNITCTPMVPYAVLQLGAAAGVMVTASHNPKDDNGYKVYWENGSQIIPPHDKGIAAAINENLEPWTYPQQYAFDSSSPLLSDPTAEMTQKYMDEIQKRYCYSPEENKAATVNVTYTAMHGVGAEWVEKAFAAFNLPPYIPTKEQLLPDPEFPTVKFPNPEEGKGALALAMKTAEANDSVLILANDPDADRLAVAEYDSVKKDWNIFNGNQIAALFADYVWKNFCKRNPDFDKSKACMVASTVSSKFLKAMGEKEGFAFRDTLTGFKWMGNEAIQMESQGYTFLFAYEVEIGFLIGNTSFDKDGVRTAAVFAEMTNHLYKQGTTLVKHLESLYQKYGYFEMNTSYFFAYTDEPLEKVFKHLREGNNGSYVDSCGPYKITGIRDVTTGYDSTTPDKKSLLPQMPDAHMITFHFDNGCVATLRNSGTEPKLKYYVEANDTTKAAARTKVDEMTDLLIKHFMRPDENGLIAKKAS